MNLSTIPSAEIFTFCATLYQFLLLVMLDQIREIIDPQCQAAHEQIKRAWHEQIDDYDFTQIKIHHKIH